MTANNKTCNIPFQYNNVTENFCVLKDSQFQCQVGTPNTYDACNLGEFIRVRSHTQGEAFDLIMDFDTPLITIPGIKYIFSMYSLVNCPKAGCDLALDIIIVKIKEGINGLFKEFYRVAGRSHDDRWLKDTFKFVTNSSRIYVRSLNIYFCP